MINIYNFIVQTIVLIYSKDNCVPNVIEAIYRRKFLLLIKIHSLIRTMHVTSLLVDVEELESFFISFTPSAGDFLWSVVPREDKVVTTMVHVWAE